MPKRRIEFCKVNGCDEPHRAKGYCGFHYDRIRQNVPFDQPRRSYDPGKICSIEGCEKPAIARGWCAMHHQRWRTRGDVNWKPENRREYGSGKEWHQQPNGYVVRYEPQNPNSGPNGQVYQHRHVMSQIVGRPLRKHENVHHINGDRSDNRPENLELWTTNQPPGQRVKDKIKWAIDFLQEEAGNSMLVDDEARENLQALASMIKIKYCD